MGVCTKVYVCLDDLYERKRERERDTRDVLFADREVWGQTVATRRRAIREARQPERVVTGQHGSNR